MRRALLTTVLAALALGAAAPAAEAARKVPRGWVGMQLDEYPYSRPGFNTGRELSRMVRSGVESIRLAFYWSRAQPYRRFQDVPASQRGRFRDVGGIPTDWHELDRVVGGAARRRLRVLPVVLTTPAWAAKYPGAFGSPPTAAGVQRYADFMGALVARYGPRGSFWAERSDLKPLPIRSWQVWNEPYLPKFWQDQPFVADYLRLLRAARRSIKNGDPGAKVVLAGLAGYAKKPWEYLADIYEGGGEPLFDQVAAHPYTRRVRGLVAILRRFRGVMRNSGDPTKPLVVTEWSWPSSKGRGGNQYSWAVTRSGQAKKVRATLRAMAKRRRSLRLRALYHYTWISRDSLEGTGDSFGWAGLIRYRNGTLYFKPGLRAFKRTALRLEGCASKRRVASRCYRRLR